MNLFNRRVFNLFSFTLVSVVLLLGVVYAQSSRPTSQPVTGGCAPNSAGDDRCAIYAIARENVERHWPGCSSLTPANCPVIPSGVSGLPAGITPGQRISVDVIVGAIILRLEAQNLPTNPPRDWTTVLAAKRGVMSGIMNSLRGPRYKGPTMIDFKGGKPRRTGGSSESQPTSQPSAESKPTIHLVSLAFSKFFSKFFEFSISSVSAQTSTPVPIPVVITVSFNNIDGTSYIHSVFCWATGVNWSNGNGRYICYNHKNQGYYIWILNSKDGKVSGERLPPYTGPNAPQEPIVKVAGTLETLISHNVPN